MDLTPVPFHRGWRLLGFLGLALASVGVISGLSLLDRADLDVPGGMARLELVGSAAGAGALVGDRLGVVGPLEDLTAVDHALTWDLLLIAVYTAAFVGTAMLVVPLFRLRALRTSTRAAVALAMVPGLLDLVEDLLLAIALHVQPQTDWWYLGAATFAVAKFAVLLALVPVLAAALATGLVTRNWLYGLLGATERVAAGDASSGASSPPPMAKRHGLALSGGGVRAATLALGSLQELERSSSLGWSRAAVTGVSGGAYMAAAWLVGRSRPQGDPGAWAMEGNGRHPGTEEQHLLDNLGYLTALWPRGRPDDPGTSTSIAATADVDIPARARYAPAVWATVATGLLVNLAVIGAVLVAVITPLALGLRFLVGLDDRCDGADGARLSLCLVAQPRIWAAPTGWFAAGILLAVVWVVAGKLTRSALATLVLKAATLGSLALGAYLALLLVALPLLIALADSLSWGLLAAAVGALAGVVGSVVRILRRFATTLAPKVGGVAFVLLLALGIGGLASATWAQSENVRRLDLVELSWTQRALFLGALVVVALIWVAASPELWSLNAFYRGKLRLAYALHRRKSGQAVPYVNDRDEDRARGLLAEPSLSGLAGGTDPDRASVTICASAHATTKGVRTHYGIPAMSFTFDPAHVQMHIPRDDQGDFTTYTCTTEEFQKAYQGAGYFTTKRITTFFGVALAGAAVSPAMGRFRIGPTSALLTFANIRLGAWLPNPRYVTAGAGRRFPIIRLGYLFKEFFSIHDPTDPFVYVSDGGHWENTGLVELLRGHMPQEVVMVDADSGSAARLRQFTSAIDLAKLECDVDVLIDLDPLRGFAQAPGLPLYAQRSVTLGVLRQGDSWGLLWYTRPVLTASTPTPLLAHREAHPDFPTTSTLNQFFDTSTYVAYRDLGRHNAEQVAQARSELVELLRGAANSADPVSDLMAARSGWVGPVFAALLRQCSPADRKQLLESTCNILGLAGP